MNFEQLRELINIHTGEHRPICLRFSPQHAHLGALLIVHRVDGSESICGGLKYSIGCVSNKAGIELSEFIAVPLEVQFVTDRGRLASVCGIIDSAAEGEADGGFASYLLTMRDALSIMEKRTNTRVFLRSSEIDISRTLISEWRYANSVLSSCFVLDIRCREDAFPASEFIMQHNETDAAFLRRLWKRRGIAWTVGPSAPDGRRDMPSHTLTLFDDVTTLAQNSAGAIRYHHTGGVEQRDCVRTWTAVRTLQAGAVNRAIWHLPSATLMRTARRTQSESGQLEAALSASLDDYVIDTPHAHIEANDYEQLGDLRMLRHDYKVNAFYASSDIRDLRVGEWNRLTGHYQLERFDDHENEFVLTRLNVEADNNLPQGLGIRFADRPTLGTNDKSGVARYRNDFTCVRRSVPIVPSYDPANDLPAVHPTVAIVVCDPNWEAQSNEHGWIRVRIPGCRIEDHEHARGAGCSDTTADSAWVPVASPWAGHGHGFKGSYRKGDTVLLTYLGGDPDCPIVTGALHSGAVPPVAFSNIASMPGNQLLSGIKSKEVGGTGYNQLRFDDTPGRISAQLCSAHAQSELNLGFLTHPPVDGFGTARGEDAELRSDGSVALRGACGVLISADGRARGSGGQLDRDRLAGLAESLEHVQTELNRISEGHGAASADVKPVAAMVDSLRSWDQGTNVDPYKPLVSVSKPLVAVDAPNGLVAGSGDAILLGAQTNVDIVSVRDTHFTSGGALIGRALKGLSFLAHRLGVKLIAASGKVQIEAHQDDIELTAAKRIMLAASQEIIIQAPKVTILSQGVQTTYEAGNLTSKMTGTFTVYKKHAEFTGPAEGELPEVTLPSSETRHNQRVLISDMTSGLPLPQQKYRITLEDGNVVEGTTDGEGMTETFDSSIAFGGFKIELIDDQ